MIHLPILLIHGFNGAPTNWTGPSDRFPEFLAEHGFDPDLIRVFGYGYDMFKGKRTYNNLGDIRQIAHRLDDPNSADAHDCSVDVLSRDSVARGGPRTVTIIAHSSGGLVARYYLTRREQDQFGTRYRGNVGRAIFLGTPHRGVDVEDILDPLPTNMLVYRLMVRVHYLLPPEYSEQSQSLRQHFSQLHETTRKAFYGESSELDTPGETPAFKQMHPGSEFLQDINRPGGMPDDAEYHNIIGDIRAGVRIEAFGRTVLDREKSFGDFLVSAESAGSIPNAPSITYPIVDEHCLQVDVGRRVSQLVQFADNGEHPIPIHRYLRSLPAARRRMLAILIESGADKTKTPDEHDAVLLAEMGRASGPGG
jgi:pimeloyl-ACP methyl ester carboxylesterase